MRRTLEFLFVVVVGLGLGHLAWSALIVGGLRVFYDHRVINVREMKNEGTQWEDFTTAYYREVSRAAKNEGRPLAVFVGSSVTYGYPWQEPVTFSRLVSDQTPELRVANLSLIGAGARALTDFALCGFDGSSQADVVFVEVPLINSTSSMRAGVFPTPRLCQPMASQTKGYWSLVLPRPYGTGWIPLLWDEDAYFKPERDIVLTPLPPTYFADRVKFDAIKDVFRHEMADYIESAADLGKKVYVYVSPIYFPAIEELGGDRQAVEEQVELAMEICRSNVRVTCLDTDVFGHDRTLFYNISHLNQRGHRAMARWFRQHLSASQVLRVQNTLGNEIPTHRP